MSYDVEPSYDVIIVGAGSSGAPLAARLSEDPARSVLLIEAGPRFEGPQQYPRELRHGGILSAMMPGHPNNWDLVAKLGNGMMQPLPRGKVVGGSSALNGTLFTRGHRADFDEWAAEGNPEWAYEKVLPFFRKLETDSDFTDQYHGAHGPMPISRVKDTQLVAIDRAFILAAQQAGFAWDSDMNGPDSIGVGLLPVNNAAGIRFNTALAYLDPADARPNLTIQSDAEVHRILFDGRRAMGVEVTIGGKTERVFAGEVVLSAGAVKSPQLLMCSGIGPAEELSRHGIKLRQDLPMVGRGFTDHCSLTMPFRMPKRSSPMPDPLESTWAHVGLHFTSQVSDAVSDLLIMQSSIPTSYLVFYGQSFLTRLKTLRAVRGTMSLGKLLDHARYGFDHALTCIMMRDDSRGEIRLTSADCGDRPELLYRYLESDRDRARARELMRTAAELLTSEPYRRLGVRRAVLSNSELSDDAALDAHNLRHMGTSIHMASSCRMGQTVETSVVDQFCRVHEIERLRVVDTSIMPAVVRRCPAATAVMLGERAAEFFN